MRFYSSLQGFDKLQSTDDTVDAADNPDALLQKSAALLRAFATVVRSIGQPFHANDGTAIAESFILDVSLQFLLLILFSSAFSVAAKPSF